MKATFTVREIEAMRDMPEVLEALSNWHECQEAAGDAMGFDFSGNKKRAEELLTAAKQIRDEFY